MKNKNLKVVAIIAAYNEGDVIYHVIKDLVENDVMVYLIDHSSTDNTAEEAGKWLGKGLIKVERYPEESGFPPEEKDVYAWENILKRKEQVSYELNADWYIHHDADEFRECPWGDLSLRDAISMIDEAGYNSIDFYRVDFRPVDDCFTEGEDVRKYLKYFLRNERYSNLQVKCWKNFGQAIDLVSSMGHDVTFEGRKTFPLKFILRHYPIRGQKHGRRKILDERLNRYSKSEREKGFHRHYDNMANQEKFIWNIKDLYLYEKEKVRFDVLIDCIKAMEGQLLDKDLHIENLQQRGGNLSQSFLSRFFKRKL